MKTNNQLTATNLQEVLWKTLNGVQAGSVKVPEANAIAGQSREICRVTKLQLDYARLAAKGKKANIKLLK